MLKRSGSIPAVILLLAGGTLPAAAQDAAPALSESWRLSGFQSPESVLYDEANDRIIIGNMGAMAPDAGADGYLSLVSADGEITQDQWVTGLRDPKGMAIVGDHLFVADSDGLAELDLQSGEILQTIPLEGAQFPNDVAADGLGNVYVSDLMGETIYKVTNGAASVWLSDEALTLPNGLFVDGDTLVVGSMGEGLDPSTFAIDMPGGLVDVDFKTKQVAPVDEAAGLGGLDGVAMWNGWILTDDNPTGTLYAYKPGQDPVKLITLSPGAADLYAYDDTVLVPLTQDGELVKFAIGG